MFSKKILIIEDDYLTSKLLSNYLNKWGYKFIIVSSGQQALEEIWDGTNYFAVIFDIELSNTDIQKLFKNIHDRNNSISIIACFIDKDQQRISMVKAIEYFAEPEILVEKRLINLEDFASELEAILNSKQQIFLSKKPFPLDRSESRVGVIVCKE